MRRSKPRIERGLGFRRVGIVVSPPLTLDAALVRMEPIRSKARSFGGKMFMFTQSEKSSDAPSAAVARNGGFTVDPHLWPSVGESLHLTPRELSIVRAMFAGLREDDIALRLGISPHTVHTHMGRLYRKLEVDSGRGLLLRVFSALLSASSQL